MTTHAAQERRRSADGQPRGPRPMGEWMPGRTVQRDFATGGEGMARFLGLFSIGLGLVQLVAPGGLARFIGVRDNAENRTLMRGIGLRELASGIAILTRRHPVMGVRSRILGDMMDLTLLASAFQDEDHEKGRLAFATLMVAQVTMLDVICSGRLSTTARAARKVQRGDGIPLEQSVTVDRPLDEVYAFWRNFENLPRFMTHLEEVRVLDERRSHWKAKGPAGMSIEWDAELVEDRPNELIRWRSVEGAEVNNSGAVRFLPAPGNRGTEIHVQLQYDPPFGAFGAGVAGMLGEEPELQVADDLRAFKQVMEIGEVVRSEGAVPGERLSHRPARPERKASAS